MPLQQDEGSWPDWVEAVLGRGSGGGAVLGRGGGGGAVAMSWGRWHVVVALLGCVVT